MNKLKKYKINLKEYREDINLYLYKYSNISLSQLKKLNKAVKSIEEVMNNVKVCNNTV